MYIIFDGFLDMDISVLYGPMCDFFLIDAQGFKSLHKRSKMKRRTKRLTWTQLEQIFHIYSGSQI